MAGAKIEISLRFEQELRSWEKSYIKNFGIAFQAIDTSSILAARFMTIIVETQRYQGVFSF